VADDPRLSLRRPSLSSLSWWLSTSGGLALFGVALVCTGRDLGHAGGPALWMTAAILVVLELRPVIASGRHDPHGVTLSTAFVFALLYTWGLWPAVVAQSLATIAAELRKRKAPSKLLFNVGQYNLSLAAGWLVLRAAGASPSLAEPLSGLVPDDVPWVLGSWVVYFTVNNALVSGVLSYAQSFRSGFTEDLGYYVTTTFSVLALSPVVVVLAEHAWGMLPLLLVPLGLVYKTASMSLEQEHRAAHDDLTGLPNRAGFADALRSGIEDAGRSAGTCALLLLDLDRFKEVNDTLGHPVGDRLLVTFADRLRGSVRPTDTVARLGGDEFAVILPGADVAEARAVAERIAASLVAPVVVDGHPLQLAASIGICLHPAQGRDAETLLQLADVAMYVAKEAGSGIAVYSAQDDRFANDRRRARLAVTG
jgi:diguanylate cyclase (GGDEF)-like protein